MATYRTYRTFKRNATDWQGFASARKITVERGLTSVRPDTLDVLRLGAFQLLHLDRVPVHAAVQTSVGVARRRVERPPLATPTARQPWRRRALRARTTIAFRGRGGRRGALPFGSRLNRAPCSVHPSSLILVRRSGCGPG